MKSNGKSLYIIFAAICLVYILLRLWNLTESCLWFDEIFSIHAAEHSWEALFWFVAQDLIHPPLFYILLKIWISMGGESLFWLRFFPVFFSIAALIPFYFLCRQLKLEYGTIALALSFFAVNGALIKYAQEVRMYSQFLCISLFSLWLFSRFFYLGKSYVALIIVNVLLVYTHYFGWFVIASEIIAILILQRIKIRQISIMLGICLISFAPWIFAVWRAAQINADFGQNIGWMNKPDFVTVFQFIFDLIEPLYYQASNIDAASNYLITIPLFVIIITAIIYYLSDWKNKTEIEKQDFYLLGIFTAVPILLAFIASWLLPHSIWGTRHLIIVFAPLAILLAILINKINIRILKIFFDSMLCVLCAVAFMFQLGIRQSQFIWCGWEVLAQKIDSGKPQKIYVFEDLVAYHFWFALRSESDRIRIVKVNNVEGVQEDKAYFLPRGFDSIQVTDKDGIEGEKFWVAFRDRQFNKTKPPLQDFIDKGYKIGEPEIFTAQGLKAFLVYVEK